MKETTCGLFGAITSKPQDDAKKELRPELKDKGLVYFSPIVKLRQMFNLHTNMRPCKSYPGQSAELPRHEIANPSGDDVPIDQVVFRENTEGMYGGVEFFPLPEPVYTALCANPKMKPWKDKGPENVALSTRIVSKQGCTNICQQAFEFAKKTGRKRVTLVEKPNVLRETGGLMTRFFREVAKEYPGHLGRRSEHRRDLHVDVQEPAGLLGARGREHVRRHRQRPLRRPRRRPGLRAAAPTSATSTPSSSPRTAPPRSTPASTRSTRSRCC